TINSGQLNLDRFKFW
ncbi:TPA: DUF645 family protein, partial [Vibrio cholerae]|nr:DUF645 family protein [Vibrio cholerae]HDB2529789.1 DUF645 family protein [Vibrio cholerae]HDY3951591.1 DUF645 family protein [Vibrio cholerae]